MLALRLRRFRGHRDILSRGLKSSNVDFEGLRFHYYHADNGRPPLIMLHGFLDSAQTFRKLLPELLERFDLYVIDTPGFGYTRMPPVRELWDLRSMARSMARFVRKKLELRDARLLTHSMGGLIAAHMAEYIRETEQVALFSRMDMIAPGMFRLPEQDRDTARRRLYPRDTYEIKELLRTLYHADMPMPPDIVLKGLLREWTRVGYYYLAENTIESEDEMFFTPARLRALKTPLRLYWGEEDKITPLEMARKIKRAVKGTKLFTFPDAGHALHLVKGREVLEAFLND